MAKIRPNYWMCYFDIKVFNTKPKVYQNSPDRADSFVAKRKTKGESRKMDCKSDKTLRFKKIILFLLLRTQGKYKAHIQFKNSFLKKFVNLPHGSTVSRKN